MKLVADLLDAFADSVSTLLDAAQREAEDRIAASKRQHRGLASDAMAVARSPHVLAALGATDMRYTRLSVCGEMSYELRCKHCGKWWRVEIPEMSLAATQQPMLDLVLRLRDESRLHEVRCAGGTP